MKAAAAEVHPLVKLYGENVFDLASLEIKELAKNSNIPFTNDFIKLGASFTALNAQKIIDGKAKERTLKDLISKSFGEAAIYKYNVEGCDESLQIPKIVEKEVMK